jgi:hypothetical protein
MLLRVRNQRNVSALIGLSMESNLDGFTYCLCGHDVNRHMDAGEGSTPMCCDCFLDDGSGRSFWHLFKLDNLKYLEMKDNERNG